MPLRFSLRSYIQLSTSPPRLQQYSSHEERRGVPLHFSLWSYLHMSTSIPRLQQYSTHKERRGLRPLHFSLRSYLQLSTSLPRLWGLRLICWLRSLLEQRSALNLRSAVELDTNMHGRFAPMPQNTCCRLRQQLSASKLPDMLLVH